MQALEDAEKFVDEAHLEAHAVVRHLQAGAVGARRTRDPDARGVSAARVLQRVAEQVSHRHLNQERIAPKRRQRPLDGPFDAPAVLLQRELAHQVVDHQFGVEGAAAQAGASHARELEQGLDQLNRERRRGLHLREVTARTLAEPRALGFEHQIDKSRDVPHRRPQVVRDGVRKRLEFLVQARQLGRRLGALLSMAQHDAQQRLAQVEHTADIGRRPRQRAPANELLPSGETAARVQIG